MTMARCTPSGYWLSLHNRQKSTFSDSFGHYLRSTNWQPSVLHRTTSSFIQLGRRGLDAGALLWLLVVTASLATPVAAYSTSASRVEGGVVSSATAQRPGSSGDDNGGLTSSTSSRLVKLLVSDGVLTSRHYCMEPVETSISRDQAENVVLTIRLTAVLDQDVPARYDTNTGQRLCLQHRAPPTSEPDTNSTKQTSGQVKYIDNKDRDQRLLLQQQHYIAKLTTSQLWIVAICSVIIGSMFIVAISLRIRNHIRRIYNDDSSGNRPMGMSPYSGQSFFNNNDLFQRT